MQHVTQPWTLPVPCNPVIEGKSSEGLDGPASTQLSLTGGRTGALGSRGGGDAQSHARDWERGKPPESSVLPRALSCATARPNLNP